jgi:tRNA (guanine37-N1)-methyltransferase
MYRFDILTLFPDSIQQYFQESILGKAIENKLIEVHLHDFREYTTNKHKNVDDTPYGGGAGMVLTPQPVYDCIQEVKKHNQGKVIFLSPRGTTFKQSKAETLSRVPEQSLILICGRYEGLDQRAIDLVVDEEISIGDYVLAGGEIGSLILVESIARLIPGVLGKDESHQTDSFSEHLDGKKQHPLYTKPSEFMGLKVPEVLMNGNHGKIQEWKKDNLK